MDFPIWGTCPLESVCFFKSGPYPNESLSCYFFLDSLGFSLQTFFFPSLVIMATTIHNTHSIQTSANYIGQENGHPSSSQPLTLPRWPRYLCVASHILAIIFTATIIGLVSFCLRKYFDTRNINFSGINESWPQDLNLQPSYIFLAVSSLSLAFSTASCAYLFLRRKSTTFTAFDIISLVMSGVIFVIWVLGDVSQTQSHRHPTADILKWSCRRSDSPTNAIVSYASVCYKEVRFNLAFSAF